MSLGTGRPIVLRDENTIRHCRLLLTHPMSSPTDVRLISLVELIAHKSKISIYQSTLHLNGLQHKFTTSWPLWTVKSTIMHSPLFDVQMRPWTNGGQVVMNYTVSSWQQTTSTFLTYIPHKVGPWTKIPCFARCLQENYITPNSGLSVLLCVEWPGTRCPLINVKSPFRLKMLHPTVFPSSSILQSIGGYYVRITLNFTEHFL